MAAFSRQKTAENDRFRDFLRSSDGSRLDAAVQELDKTVTPLVDCTACGNCCKSLMIVVTDAEADTLAAHLQQSRPDFDAAYLEKGGHELMVINRMPCHFLTDNKCTVYEHRFAGCREFPALHVPGFRARLFTTFMHYDRCSIIFNVMERLKTVLKFERDVE
jgi:Fe-S-cluster containining protein